MSTLEGIPVRQQEIEIALKTFYNTTGLGLEARPPLLREKALSLDETLEDPISLKINSYLNSRLGSGFFAGLSLGKVDSLLLYNARSYTSCRLKK